MSQPAPKDLDWVRRRLDDWLTDARKSANESGHSGREQSTSSISRLD